MGKISKVISLTVIITLLLSCLPRQVFQNSISSIQTASASVHLTREEAGKYEGIISAETDRTVVLVEDGSVMATSSNGQNDLRYWQDMAAIASGNQHTVGLKKDGTAVAAGNEAHGRLNVEEWSNLVNVAAGAEHTVGLRSDGTVVAVGNDQKGQLGVHHWEGIVNIAAGARHTVGVKADGTVVAVGDTQDKQTNVEGWKDIVSVAAGFAHTVGLKKDGTVVATGLNDYGQSNVQNWTNIVSIAAGESFTVGLKADGTVVAAGYNENGQIDVSHWTGIIAISASVWHTVGLRADGSLVATGDYNWNGQTDVNGWQDLVQVDTNGQHTVGLKTDGTVVGQGVNWNGQLDIESWQDITAIEAGYQHTVGLKKDGTVVATGNKEYDKGQTNVSSWKDIVAISAGSDFTVGLKRDGTVVATGYNWYGQTNVSDWRDIVAISAGFSHTVGLKADGTVVSAGYEGYGMRNLSGWEDIIAISAGVNHTVGLKSDGTVISVGSNDHGESNVSDWTDIVAINAGGGSTVGLKADGTVLGTGEFWGGSKSVNDWKNLVAVNGKNATVGLKKDGTAVTIGQNAANELNISPIRHTLTGILSLFDVSKKVGKAGDEVVITVKFAKKVQSGVKISLRGAVSADPTVIEEVSGSDGQEYEYTFTVPNQVTGKVHFALTEVIDETGFKYNDLYVNNQFEIDGEAPILFGVTAGVVNVNSSFDPMEGVHAYDSIAGNLTSEVLVTGTVDISKMGNYTLTYTAVDPSGNSVSKSRVLSVVDREKPILEGVQDKTVKMGETFDPFEGVSAVDNADGDITQKIQVTGEVDNTKPNAYTLFYSVTDKAGNTATAERKVTVVDTVAPVFSGIGDVTINLEAAFNPLADVTAFDNVDGDVTGSIQVTGTVNTKVKGSYNLTYNVTDSSGNTSEKVRVVTVKDHIKPVFMGTTNQTIDLNTVFDKMAGVTASDNVDGDLTSEIQVTGEVNTEKKGIYTLKYSVKDSSGNTAEATRKITVLDTVAPVISGATDKLIKVNSFFDPKEGITAIDNEDGDLSGSIVVTGSVNTAAFGSYTLTYTSTDTSGNSSSVKRTISVIKTGWIKEEGYWLYYDSKTGLKKTGWLLDGGKWYYLDGFGIMKTGWIQSGGKWYYLDGNGVMKTGWIQSGGKWYYLDGNGVMKTGWVQLGGKWYYLDGNGAMKTGWVQSGGKWYYLEASGVMKTGWLLDGSKWYYLNAGGVMQTGWVRIGSKSYYFNSGGIWIK
jgi:alpha-tubulin suppressor-like RCC1 family protein